MTITTKNPSPAENLLGQSLEELAIGLSIDLTAFKEKAQAQLTALKTPAEQADSLIKLGLEEIDELNEVWTYFTARIYLRTLLNEAKQNRKQDTDYAGFYQLVTYLSEIGIYDSAILEHYSKDELELAGTFIDPSKDLQFTYPGLYTLSTRYLARDHNKRVFECPQERFLIIALTLMQKETTNRLEKVKEAYWALSNQYMTVATPTLSNAGKQTGQLSSCFIDTIDDSLDSIYQSNANIASLSKNGGGIGVYIGKVRARGSSIRGFKKMSSGVIPWIKQLNNTAISVDQLGTRKGAVTVYLDIWHRDIEDFLDLKLNNGDERMRAHDIYTGVSLPDLFMEQVKNRGDWYLFDPHEVRETTGKSLEDFYDEEKANGSFSDFYHQLIHMNLSSMKKVQAIDLMKRVMRSQLETGTPFMFYRDEVNRKNPNAHAGMIYCSNLCTEITQNQSASGEITTTVDEDGYIVKRYLPGDYVVCNLSSINLGRAVTDDVLSRLIKIQVRMLDNVIDINALPLKEVMLTNQKYRAIGLGTFGWHHLLALKNIAWESDEAVQYSDTLYEEIAYHTIKESMLLSKEKGSYPLFSGSRFEDGSYFEDKGYDNEAWLALKDDVQTHGLRNGYLMAVAPNASTSVIAGSTASTDPIFKPFYTEEKKDYRIPIVAPDLNPQTYNIYRRSSYILDQRYSVRQTAKRQRHIDQSISFNFYVPHTIKAKQLLDLHILAYDEGLKTTYYVRSTSTDVEGCEWCES